MFEGDELAADPAQLVVQLVEAGAELGAQLVAQPVLGGGLGGLRRVQLVHGHLEAALVALLGGANGVVDAGLDAAHDRAQHGARVHATSSIRDSCAHRRSSAPSAARRCSGVIGTAGPQPCANSVCSGRSTTVVPVKRTFADGNSSEKR